MTVVTKDYSIPSETMDEAEELVEHIVGIEGKDVVYIVDENGVKYTPHIVFERDGVK